MNPASQPFEQKSNEINNSNNPADQKTQSSKNIFWDIVWSIILILILFVIIPLRVFVYQQVNVVGPSMQPNYFTDEQLFINATDKNLDRGQVVAVYEDKTIAANANYFTRFSAKFFLKRVIAFPGEEVEMVGDKVIIYNSQYPNGVVLNEDYISDEVKTIEKRNQFYFPRTKILENSYFLLGDNRIDSLDSRVKGAFPNYTIFGKEVAKYLPINKFRTFNLPTYQYEPISDEIKSLQTKFAQEKK